MSSGKKRRVILDDSDEDTTHPIIASLINKNNNSDDENECEWISDKYTSSTDKEKVYAAVGITARQMGSKGIEYEVLHDDHKGHQYKRWVRVDDMDSSMIALKEAYDKDTGITASTNSSSSFADKKGNVMTPTLNRQTSTGTRSSSRTKSVSSSKYSAKLEKLRTLRNKSREGIGALHDSSSEDSGYEYVEEDTLPLKEQRKSTPRSTTPRYPVKLNEKSSSKRSKCKFIADVGSDNESDNEDGSLADFIVRSDEEVDDEESQEDDDDDEAFEDTRKKNIRHSKKRKSQSMKGSSKSSSNKKSPSAVRKRLIVDDDEDSDEDDSSGDSQSEDNREEDQSETEEGRSMYWQMSNANDRDVNVSSGNSSREIFSIPGALCTYVEMIGQSIVSAEKGTELRYSSQMIAASRRIQNLICTTRESLLGSGAWRGDFLQQLKSRPFYSSSSSKSSSEPGEGHVCAACGRQCKYSTFKVYLFGPTYNSDKAWSELPQWIKAIPNVVLGIDDAESDSDSSIAIEGEDVEIFEGDRARLPNANNGLPDQNVSCWWKQRYHTDLLREPESKYNINDHCRRRTHLYHTLMHYKIRLLLKIKEYLRVDRHGTRTVSSMMTDSIFLDREVKRFQDLIQQSSEKWGSSEEHIHVRNHAWSDDEENQSSPTSRTNTSRSQGSRRATQQASLSRWLYRQDQR